MIPELAKRVAEERTPLIVRVEVPYESLVRNPDEAVLRAMVFVGNEMTRCMEEVGVVNAGWEALAVLALGEHSHSRASQSKPNQI